jgi:hypothetical protein
LRGKLRLKYKPFAWIILICVFLVLPLLIGNVSAQTQSNYYVTVKPTTPDSPMYTASGRNWTLSFESQWSYGADSGKNIPNATVAIEVHNRANQLLETLSLNTTYGTITFNYTSSTVDILTFTPTKLTTDDGKDWKAGIVDSSANVYGLQSKSAVVWYDTFHVSLVSSDTGSLGKVGSTVNVTYLLVPEEGLTLPAWATYNNQTYLTKTVQGANININGVKAQESQTPGIYTADSSTFFQTAYVNVKVSQERWTTTNTGFSFAQNANQQIWIYTVGLGLALAFAAAILYFFKSGKANNPVPAKHSSFPFFGGVLLIATSVISLYWGLVGLEGTLHTFDWLPLALLGMLTFAFGIGGSLMAFKKRNQALVIFSVMAPMAVNIVVVKASLDMYHLANPWLILITSVFASIIAGYFICNSDAGFQKTTL